MRQSQVHASTAGAVDLLIIEKDVDRRKHVTDPFASRYTSLVLLSASLLCLAAVIHERQITKRWLSLI